VRYEPQWTIDFKARRNFRCLSIYLISWSNTRYFQRCSEWRRSIDSEELRAHIESVISDISLILLRYQFLQSCFKHVLGVQPVLQVLISYIYSLIMVTFWHDK
jgi:hypothetical protein